MASCSSRSLLGLNWEFSFPILASENKRARITVVFSVYCVAIHWPETHLHTEGHPQLALNSLFCYSSISPISIHKVHQLS